MCIVALADVLRVSRFRKRIVFASILQKQSYKESFFSLMTKKKENKNRVSISGCAKIIGLLKLIKL